MQFTINSEAMKTLNSEIMVEAFFRYVKDVSKNKTPVTMSLIRRDGCWEAELFECSTPASSFGPIMLSAEKDNTAVGETVYVSLTTKTLAVLQDGTTYNLDGTCMVIKSGALKVKEAYDTTSEEAEAHLKDFRELLSSIPGDIDYTIDKSMDIYRFLQVVGSSQTASIYLENGKMTLRDDTFFFRTALPSYSKDAAIFVNMYIANKILGMLEYCNRVELKVSNTFRIEGFIDGIDDPVATNVSTVFDPEEENPTDEDLVSITPVPAESEVASIALAELCATFDNVKDKIRNFIETKDYECHLFKNGKGISFLLEAGGDSLASTKMVLNVGEVENEEPAEQDFTVARVVLPLKHIQSIVGGNAVVDFVFDNQEDTAVSIQTPDYLMLTGKIY